VVVRFQPDAEHGFGLMTWHGETPLKLGPNGRRMLQADGRRPG
jgi:hypothetical protein